ncbi:MAG: ABC transporter permease [Chloroflexota bacterium]
MKLWESIRLAWHSLGANKLRSALTTLGIIIGVAAVIALLSLGRGVQTSITSQIQSIGTNLLYVRPGAQTQGGVRAEVGSAVTLTLDDARALADPANVPSAVAVAPQVNSFGQVVASGQNVRTQILGVTPEYAQVRNYQVLAGEFIQASHVTARSAVAVLGYTTAANLFGEPESAVGQSIRINGQPFRVIGVLASKGTIGPFSQDDLVMVPLTTVQTRLFRGANVRGSDSVSLISVQVADASLINQATQEIAETLRQRHRVLYEDDFTISSQQDVLNTALQITGALTLFLGGIAAISLLVGGIGIMNIMLVTVTERTREIGIRKAVGARRRDILAQFLIEAIMLSVMGGVLGIAVGWGISRLLGNIQLGTTAIQPEVGLDAVLMATLFSMAVGIFFGIYPASRAAALNPIEALRYE